MANGDDDHSNSNNTPSLSSPSYTHKNPSFIGDDKFDYRALRARSCSGMLATYGRRRTQRVIYTEAAGKYLNGGCEVGRKPPNDRTDRAGGPGEMLYNILSYRVDHKVTAPTPRCRGRHAPREPSSSAYSRSQSAQVHFSSSPIHTYTPTQLCGEGGLTFVVACVHPLGICSA